MLLYENLINSVITYGQIVWSQCNVTDFKRIDRTIRKCLNYVMGKSKDEILVKKTILYSFNNSVIYNQLLYFYKIINGHCNFSPDIFQRVVSKYNGRSQNNMNYSLPKFSKHCTQKTFFYTVIKNYNKLPINIKSANTIAEFKSMLKIHLIMGTIQK